jgi:hypothetical protein
MRIYNIHICTIPIYIMHMYKIHIQYSKSYTFAQDIHNVYMCILTRRSSLHGGDEGMDVAAARAAYGGSKRATKTSSEQISAVKPFKKGDKFSGMNVCSRLILFVHTSEGQPNLNPEP